ncbi:outer membrane lipase/esterase [Microdochium nivale]|nr:outer membrane lipase/esterase [Microdochium nivale]
MMSMSLRLLLALSVVPSCVYGVPTLPPHSDNVGFDWDSIEHVIAFGNSFTYIQGTAGRQNYSFIGDYLPGNFTFAPEKLLSNKIVADYTGTSAGGPNWIQHLTNCGVEPGVYSPTQCGSHHDQSPGQQRQGRRQRELWDFAFAGANYAEEFLPLHHDYTVPMVNQTQQYLSYAHPFLAPRFHRNDRRDVLVAVWIGINDINDITLPPPAADDEQTSTQQTPREDEQLALYEAKYDAINAALFEQSIIPLHQEAGFRNFLFLNIPPYDRTPGNVLRKEEDRHPSRAMVQLWNKSLAKHLAAFQERVNGDDAQQQQQHHDPQSARSSLPQGQTTSTRSSNSSSRAKDRVTTALLYDANAFLDAVLDDPLVRGRGILNTRTICAAAKGNPDVARHPSKYGCLPLDKYFWFDAGHITSHVHELMAEDIGKFLKSSSSSGMT